MKKNENYIAVNNQEDEDGYTLYPGYAIYNGNIRENQIVSVHHKAANTQPGSPRSKAPKLTISTFTKPRRNKKDEQ